MPPPSVINNKVWLCWIIRSIKENLYTGNIDMTTEGLCRSKRLTFILQSNLGYEYETNTFSS